jgi:hypothetical protein
MKQLPQTARLNKEDKCEIYLNLDLMSLSTYVIRTAVPSVVQCPSYEKI